jgi:LacI family transcriptional regulator
MSAISNPYFAELAHAIEREAAQAGYTLLLADTHDDPERELRATKDLLGRRVDDVILAPSAQPSAALEVLRKRAVPIVLIDRFMPVELDQIATENIAPTARLVEHLAGLGHERIGMIAGLEGLATSEERIEGYRRGLASASLPFDPELVVRGDSDAEPARAAIAQATTQIGEQAVTMLLSRLANPGLAVRKVQLEPKFVHRESCGCSAAHPN